MRKCSWACPSNTSSSKHCNAAMREERFFRAAHFRRFVQNTVPESIQCSPRQNLRRKQHNQCLRARGFETICLCSFKVSPSNSWRFMQSVYETWLMCDGPRPLIYQSAWNLKASKTLARKRPDDLMVLSLALWKFCKTENRRSSVYSSSPRLSHEVHSDNSKALPITWTVQSHLHSGLVADLPTKCRSPSAHSKLSRKDQAKYPHTYMISGKKYLKNSTGPKSVT